MANPTQRDVKSWVDASRCDLDTAKALLQSRRYVYVLSCASRLLRNSSRRTWRHKLPSSRPGSIVWCTSQSSRHLTSPEEKTLLERLSLYYIQSRYPPEVQALGRKVTRSMAAAHLERVEALWKRVRRKLALKK